MQTTNTGYVVVIPNRHNKYGLLQTFLISVLAFFAGNFIRAAKGGGIFDPYLNLIFIEDWKLSQYFFKYSEIGFAKRALIGTLLDINSEADAPVKIFLILLIALLITSLILFRLLSVREAHTRLLFAASPAVFMQFGYDFGRFDLINTALLMLFIYINGRFLALFCISMLLIHEGSIATHIPMLFLIYYIIHGLDRGVIISGFAVLLSFLALLFWTINLSPEEMIKLYPDLNEDSLGVLDQSIKENIYISMYRVYSMGAVEIFGFLVCMLYGALLAVPILKKRVWYIIPCIMPICLSIVALDFARWIAISCFNLALICVLCARAEEMPWKRVYRILPFSALGPIGIFFPLPMWSLILN